MTQARRGPARFRPSLGERPRSTLGPLRTTALLAGLALVVGAVTAASILVKPSHSRSFALVHGSIFLQDDTAPVAVDLANGKPTIRLLNANTLVDADNKISVSSVSVVPLQGGTLLLNTRSGEFNMVDNSGFAIKNKNGGVTLPQSSSAFAVPAGPSAYVLQPGDPQTTGSHTSVYLVGQATVQAAAALSGKTEPRAYASLAAPLSGSTGAPGDGMTGDAVSANGELWLLSGAGSTRSVHELSLPKGSVNGVQLADAAHGTTPTPAALTVASANVDGTGGDVVALANAKQIRVFAGATAETLAVTGLADVDQILPVADGTGTLSFLYHSETGWSLVSASTDGLTIHQPQAITQLPATANLLAPSASDGALYTMDRTGAGRLWQLVGARAEAIPGAENYPVVLPAEAASTFADASILAQDGRVIFNSPDHVHAIAVFSDGSHAPVEVDKTTAVDLNAVGGAVAIINTHTPKQPSQPSQTPTPITPPAAQVNNAINCSNTTQTPHVPTITSDTPGSRSVVLTWSYPLLDPQDCAPSTYTVAVALVTGAAAPPAPAPVTVQGQDGVTLTGLYPSTQYQITLTAFLNTKGTPAAPIIVTTGPEGPAAPTAVQTTTDSSGNWTISWQSCGTVAQGCVPAASWTLTPTFCDGVGLQSPLTPISVTADPTLTQFSATFDGTDATLGRGLSFQVEGIGAAGTVGTPAADGTCTYSWTPPIASSFTLTASTPATTFGASATATLALNLGSDPIADSGGAGAGFAFVLTAPTGTPAPQPAGSASTVGSTVSQSFSGIQAGVTYTGQVTVTPPRHPEVYVTVGPVATSTSASWPALTVTPTFTPSSTNPAFGQLVLSIGGVSSAQAGGEKFDLTGSSLTCGNTSLALTDNAFDPGTSEPTFTNINRATYYGSCTVTVHLQEDAASQTTPPYFGGTVSPAVAATVTIPPPTSTETAADFTAAWSPSPDNNHPPQSDVLVTYGGSDPLFQYSRNLQVQISDDPNAAAGSCGSVGPDSALTGSPQPIATVPIDQNCVDAQASNNPPTWIVVISYTYFGQPETFTLNTISGTPPT